jgi:hypothetical protein
MAALRSVVICMLTSGAAAQVPSTLLFAQHEQSAAFTSASVAVSMSAQLMLIICLNTVCGHVPFRLVFEGARFGVA